MQAEQVKALHAQGMDYQSIAENMKLDVMLVKSIVNADPVEFNADERAQAKNVIVSIMNGGVDVSPREQLKAALYIHGGKQEQANASITALQRMILEAQQAHQRYHSRKATPVEGTVIDA